MLGWREQVPGRVPKENRECRMCFTSAEDPTLWVPHVHQSHSKPPGSPPTSSAGAAYRQRDCCLVTKKQGIRRSFKMAEE